MSPSTLLALVAAVVTLPPLLAVLFRRGPLAAALDGAAFGARLGAALFALLPHAVAEAPRPRALALLVGAGLLVWLAVRSRPPGARSVPWLEALGAVAGAALVVLVGRGGTAAGSQVWATAWRLTVESAPALLLGLVMAGLATALVPHGAAWLARGGPVGQALRGMAFGLPLPVCSCGVVPLYHSLITKGAPPTAALAFLVATPELGLDAVLLSWPLLGPELALARVVGAAAVAMAVGLIVGRVIAHDAAPFAVAAGDGRVAAADLPSRLSAGLRWATRELVDHTLPWILVGLLVAALAAPLLDPAWLTRVPSALAVVLLALLGLPSYVCAAGATPLVAVLVHQGLSPGAALAFLLTGPATNVTTFGVLARLHGRRLAAGFGACMLALAIMVGLLVDAVLPRARGMELAALEAHAPTTFGVVCVLVLGLLTAVSLLRQGPRGFVGQLGLGAVVAPAANPPHEHPGHSCPHVHHAGRGQEVAS